MIFIDANIFIRFLARDDPDKAAACRDLFRDLQIGPSKAMTSESVIAEVVFVLSSRNLYNVPPPAIQERLLPLLNLSGLHIPERKTIVRGLELYAQFSFLDFEDALSLAHMERVGVTEIVSYDRVFDRIHGFDRSEPRSGGGIGRG